MYLQYVTDSVVTDQQQLMELFYNLDTLQNKLDWCYVLVSVDTSTVTGEAAILDTLHHKLYRLHGCYVSSWRSYDIYFIRYINNYIGYTDVTSATGL